MRNSDWFNLGKVNRNYFGTKSQRSQNNTNSVISFTESTAASTRFQYNHNQIEINEEMWESIWAAKEEKPKTNNKETFVGEDAIKNYYKRYKQVSRDPNRYGTTASIEFIKETNRLRIPPTPLGLFRRESESNGIAIRRRSRPNEINIKHYNIGNNYGKALGKTIKHIKPKALILGWNKNNKGISNIV